MLPLRLLEKQEQTKPKSSRRGEIIKIRAKINEIETKESMKQKADSLKKPHKIDKPLANLTKMRREKTKVVKSEMKKGK
jgi:hypothetical protein